MNRIVDSHAHFPDLATTINQLQAAATVGVVAAVAIGTDLTENTHVLSLVSQLPNLFGAIGIYPNSNQDQSIEELVETLRTQVNKSQKIVALGECGIDISEWHGARPLSDQIKLFDAQLQLAIELNLPIVIHNRNGDAQVLAALARYAPYGLRGVAHCFNSSWETARQLLDLGMYISFSGFLTHNSKSHLLEVAQKAPLDRVVVETDSPYILPKGVSNDGKAKNEPKNVRMVVQKLADVRGISYDVAATATFNNTCELFRLTL